MICEHIELHLESMDDRDLAKGMMKFWLYQAEQARQHYQATSSQIDAALRANEEATEEWRKSDEFGFGPHLPFTKSWIEQLQDRLSRLKRNHDEARAMAGYIINYITDRAHQ